MTRHTPLRGVRVIDFTTFLSGPFCTQMLGDLGAEIIKIEPFSGDSSRTIPPHFIGADSAYYLSTNRNKRSIALDLKTSDGLRIAHDLIGKADIVVENFRPGVCAKLGLSPENLRAEFPALIWVSISGFGQVSPWRDQPAYDMTVQALSGAMSLTGEPGRPAVRLGVPSGDITAGMYAVSAALAALFDRQRGGGGRTIDISMLDGLLTMLSYQAQYHLVSGEIPGPQAARHDSIPTYRSFVGADGRELVVTANTDRMWIELCNVLGLPELPSRSEFSTHRQRLTNRAALWALLEPAFLTRPAEQWVALLSARGVPAALIKNVGEALADARAHGRDMVTSIGIDGEQCIEMIGSPMKLDGGELPRVYPPSLSQDADDILREILAFSPDEIALLRRRGAVLAAAPTTASAVEA